MNKKDTIWIVSRLEEIRHIENTRKTSIEQRGRNVGSNRRSRITPSESKMKNGRKFYLHVKRLNENDV